jgi:hypothetical protein
MSRTCSIQGARQEVYTKLLLETLKKKRGLAVDGRMNNLKVGLGEMWTGSRWIPLAGLCEHNGESLGSVKAGIFLISCITVSCIRLTLYHGVSGWVSQSGKRAI